MNDQIFERIKRATLAMQRHNWEQGTVAQAFLEAGDEETANLMAVEAVNRQLPDGRCAMLGAGEAVTDPCSIGEVLINVCEKSTDPKLIEGKERLLRWALKDAPRNQEGIVYHLCRSKQFWVDSFYMLPPFLARAGYVDEAMRQFSGYWQALFNEENGLLSHQWDDGDQRFIRKVAWGVGNGWAAAGMTRVIGMLPEERKTEKQLLIDRVTLLLKSALAHQREDGLFHDVLDDPSTFREVNCGQMFAYCIYRGMREGWLDTAYEEPAERIYAAACREIDQYGLVRNVCGVPHFDAPHVAPEGQAFCILMETARRHWMKLKEC